MNQVGINSTTIGIVISVLGYELGMFLKRKFKLAIFNPLLISIIFVIICLGIFNVENKLTESSSLVTIYVFSV